MARPITNDPRVAQRLTDTAFGVMAADGASAVTVRGIAAAADCSTTAIYSLFGGKDGLLAAARRRAAHQLHQVLVDSAADGGMSGIEALARMGHAYLEWAWENPRLYEALFDGTHMATPSADPDSMGPQDPAAPLMTAIEEARQSGEIDGPPEVIATTLWAGLHGLVTLRNTGAIDQRSCQLAEPTLIRTLLQGCHTG